MALSQRDRTSLSQAGQDEIRRATAQYEAARAANDAAGMAAAHRAAEQGRAAAGYRFSPKPARSTYCCAPTTCCRTATT